MSKRNKILGIKRVNPNEISYYSGKSTSNRHVILESEAIEYVKKMGYRVTDQI